MSDDGKKGIMFNVDRETHEAISNEAKGRRQTIKAYILSLHEQEINRMQGIRSSDETSTQHSSVGRRLRLTQRISLTSYQIIWIFISFGLVVGLIGITEETVLFPVYFGLVFVTLPLVVILIFYSFPVNHIDTIIKSLLALAIIILLMTAQLLVQGTGDYLTVIISSSSAIAIAIFVIHLKTDFFTKQVDYWSGYYKNRTTGE